MPDIDDRLNAIMVHSGLFTPDGRPTRLYIQNVINDLELDGDANDEALDVAREAVRLMNDRDRYRAALEHLNATGLGGIPVQSVVQQALNNPQQNTPSPEE